MLCFCSRSQPTVSSFFSARQTCTPERSKIITEMIAKVVVGDLHPIAMVDGTHFQNLVRFLEPGYVMPSRPQITKVIEQQHATLKERIKSEFTEIEFVCLTTDAWTSTATEAYLGVTASPLSKNLGTQELCISCETIGGTTHGKEHCRMA